ncbi:MAG: hypothetical protein ABJ215_00670 [Alphaproteobacteria bacterium]
MVECVAVCQARDGSTSLRNILQSYLFFNNESLSYCGYVSDTFDLWPSLRAYVCESDPAPLYGLMMSWEQRFEVSHGLGFALPAVRAVLGADTRIIRVTRQREPHSRSLENQSQIDPEHWLGYSSFDESEFPGMRTIQRLTAPDFDEMSEEEWRAISLRERFGWFVDKQTRLTDKNIHLFRNVLTIATEDLSEPEAVHEIGKFVNPDWKYRPSPVHVHKMGTANISDLDTEDRRRIETVWQTFDIMQAVRDPAYAVEFIVQELQDRYSHEPDVVERLTARLQHAITSADGTTRHDRAEDQSDEGAPEC